MSSKPGAKPKLTEKEINQIIYWFRTEPGGRPSGKIKAAAIKEFTDQLHSEGRLKHSPSLDFWYKPGRLGTVVLDEHNKVDIREVSLPEGTAISVPDVEDLIEKKWRKKEELISNLKPLKNLAHKLVNRVNTLSNKLEHREKENAKLKSDKENLEKKVGDLEEAVFKLFRYIQLDSSDQTKVITQRALKDIYTHPDPIDYFMTFESNVQSPQKTGDLPEKSKVTSLTDLLQAKFNITSPMGSDNGSK